MARVMARKKEKEKGTQTYNTEDSPVVTDLSTSSALTSLTRGERTGSRTFSWIWSYVVVRVTRVSFKAESL